MSLSILYQDDFLAAINKPHGLAVHRSNWYPEETEFALQLLRNQTGRRVYPLHRLDRKTSGVLLFAFGRETAAQIQSQFVNHRIRKKYLAIVRGYFPSALRLDYPLRDEKGRIREALTQFRLRQTTELPIPFGKFESSRYSLIEAYPHTGRTHQIRRHCKHLFHPIIGDRPFGCNKQNKLFKEQWSMITTLLHARELSLIHPDTQEPLSILAPPSEEFQRMLATLRFDPVD